MEKQQENWKIIQIQQMQKAHIILFLNYTENTPTID